MALSEAGAMATDPGEVRRDLTARIDAFIGHFERRRLKPDAWESNWLVKAIGHTRGGDLEAAADALGRAELPPKSRIVRSVKEMTFRPMTPEELRNLFRRFLVESDPTS